ncbi:arogenate dehydratase 2-like [Hordeum vulgare subsp. vulgare]|uniref:arogenate dehydratase 2-like n=1 Tax=Hordeum vulgare subsp. vulgare TaxID=112509 RepID=UPI001D1A5043|nr:arogenate dehydratase 2-like [Hordeum vulgare subsp. vulgare]
MSARLKTRPCLGLEVQPRGWHATTRLVNVPVRVVPCRGYLQRVVSCRAGPFGQTSIVFSLEDWKPAQLLKALAVFALRDINLTKIESRPHKKRPFRVADDTFSTPVKYFNYLFYVDLEASMADPKTRNALRNLKEFAPFVRVLGSYPTDVSEA